MDNRGHWTEEASNVDFERPDTQTVRRPVIYLKIGQVVTIEGESFRVRKVTKKDVVLRSVRLNGGTSDE